MPKYKIVIDRSQTIEFEYEDDSTDMDDVKDNAAQYAHESFFDGDWWDIDFYVTTVVPYD